MAIQQITVNGGNLFALAAQYLGDATQAYRIAQLNGLRDFALNTGATLVLQLPTVNSTLTTGLPTP